MVIKYKRISLPSHHLTIGTLLIICPAVLFFAGCRDTSMETRSYPVLDTRVVTNIDQSGARLNGEILQVGTSGISDYGFVYDIFPEPTLAESDRLTFGETSAGGAFSGIATRNLVKGKTYNVRAYAVAKSTGVIVYGQIVSFVSQGGSSPEVTAFSPVEGVIGDTVVISGSNFSDNFSNNNVLFGNQVAKVIASTKSELKCIVPKFTTVGENKLSVVVAQTTIEAPTKFVLKELEILSVDPEWVTFRDLLAVEATNLPQDPDMVEATVLGQVAPIVSLTKSELVVKVPESVVLIDQAVSIKAGVQTKASPLAIKLKPPAISGFSPAEAKAGATVTIQGSNFNPLNVNQQVKFGSYVAQVITSDTNALVVNLPPTVLDESVAIQITVAGQQAESSNLFHLVSAWRKLPDNPGTGIYDPTGWSACDLAYFTAGSNSGTSLITWRYDPGSNVWTQMANYPTALNSGTSFAVGCNGYVGGGTSYTQFSEYDASANQWVARHDLPGNRYGAVSWVLNGYGYLALGTNGEFGSPIAQTLKYDHNSNTWLNVAPFSGPLPPSYRTITSYGFALDNMGYAIVINYPEKSFWRYDPGSDSWTQKANFPGNAFYKASAFSIGAKGYIIGGTKNASGYETNAIIKELWMYDPSSNQWSRLDDFPGIARQGAVVMVINNKAYYGAGFGNNNKILKDFWEFDPTKL